MSTTRELETLNNYFDEVNLGDRFVSRARTVTEADIVLYSGLSGDYHPLHTDEVFAASGPFGARIAQGALTLSLATGLEFSLLGSGESRILAFYGMDRIRCVKPVFIGDTIHVEGEVTGLEDKDETRGVVTMHQEIKNQNGDTVAVLDKRILHKKRSYDG
jgi:3-hydroxybutyryl-CoA dehydratase